VQDREYKDPKEYEKDAAKMLRDGWELLQQSQTGTHINFGRRALSTLATGGLNLLVPKIGGGKLYQRQDNCDVGPRALTMGADSV